MLGKGTGQLHLRIAATVIVSSDVSAGSYALASANRGGILSPGTYNGPMGLAHVTTTIWNLAKQGTPYEAEFLVDTGAVDSLAPQDALLATGVTPEGKAIYELASGDVVGYEFRFARVGLLGDETVAQVIFGPEEVEPILGVVALENMGLVVDPVTKTLKRLHAKPLK